MGVHLWLFAGIAAVVIVVPGPDTALVTKNAVLHGRRAALGTALGVNAGLSVWALASAFGVASVLRASDVGFTALKLIGAAYLIWLGIQALRAAGRGGSHAGADVVRATLDGRGGFRQGLLSDLANPKIGAFFTSLRDPLGHRTPLSSLPIGRLIVCQNADRGRCLRTEARFV